MCLSESLQKLKNEMRRPTCSRCLNLTSEHKGAFFFFGFLTRLRMRSAAINLIKPPSGVTCVRCKLGDAEITVIIRHCFGDQRCHPHTCDMNLDSTGNSQNDRTKKTRGFKKKRHPRAILNSNLAAKDIKLMKYPMMKVLSHQGRGKSR